MDDLKAFRVPALEEALAASFSADAVKAGAVAAGDLRSDGAASAEYRAP